MGEKFIPVKIKTTTIRDQVYNIMKEQVTSGAYRPGEKISEQTIADQLKVSRSPVREAIKQLVSEGLLEYHTNRGAHVKRYTMKNVSDSFAVRRLMEEYAVTHIREDLRRACMQEMRELRARMLKADRTDHVALDTELHRLVIRLCGNDTLLSIYDMLYSQITAFQEISMIDDAVFRQSTKAHVAILDDLLGAEDALALKVITKHLVEAEDRVRGYIGEQAHALEPAN